MKINPIWNISIKYLLLFLYIIVKIESNDDLKVKDGIVYYNSKNPSECMTDFDNSSTGIIAIFLIIPVVFLIVGIVQIKKSISSMVSRCWLFWF